MICSIWINSKKELKRKEKRVARDFKAPMRTSLPKTTEGIPWNDSYTNDCAGKDLKIIEKGKIKDKMLSPFMNGQDFSPC